MFSQLPAEMLKTRTYDQGKEIALHKKLAESTGLKIDFADAHGPRQRGICEDTNAPQCLPQGTDLSVHSQRELDHIAWELNTRSRKTLHLAIQAATHKKGSEHVNNRLLNVAAKWPRLRQESVLAGAVCQARGALNEDANGGATPRNPFR